MKSENVAASIHSVQIMILLFNQVWTWRRLTRLHNTYTLDKYVNKSLEPKCQFHSTSAPCDCAMPGPEALVVGQALRQVRQVVGRALRQVTVVAVRADIRQSLTN